MAIVPKPSGEIPNHQLSFQQQHLFHHQKSNLNFSKASIEPIIIPAIAPSLFIFLSKSRMIAGNNGAAANPKAGATTAATKPGG
jgi:hypothetical protein